MILSVTLNAALDVSYSVDRLSRGEPVRVRQVWRRPGGKGINAALVLAALGTDVMVTGLAGGATGTAVRSRLGECGRVTEALFPIAGESRQTVVAVAADGGFAEYDEPGPQVAAAEWSAFVGHYQACLQRCRFVVCAGSLPGGVPDDGYATLTGLARGAGLPVLVDSSGRGLRGAMAVPPDVLKVNRAELADLAGGCPRSCDEVLAAAAEVHRRGVPLVIVTLGPDGLLAVGEGWRRRIRPPRRAGSPVGAGDALTAGLLAGWPATAVEDSLRFAAAVAASTIGTPHAGVADPALARTLERQTAEEEL